MYYALDVLVVDVVSDLHNQVLQLGAIDPPMRGGSRRGKRPNIALGRIEGHERLMRDYFVEDPVYDARMFRQRSRMFKHSFFRILESVRKLDTTGQLELSGLQKCKAAMRILAYSIASDATKEYVRLASSTSMLALNRFVWAIRAIYEGTHLRQSTPEDLEKQVAINTECGWPDMFASLDCMHYE